MKLNDGHKICMVIIMAAFVGVGVGYCAPYWIKTDSTFASVNLGPLVMCTNSLGSNKCNLVDFDKDFGWFEISRWLSGAGVVVAMIVSMAMCCTLCSNSDSAVICQAITTAFAGLLGIAGAALFVAKREDTNTPVFGSFLGSSTALNWAFYVFIVASAINVLVGSVMCCLPRESRMGVHPI